MSERPTPRTDATRRKAFPSDQTPDYDGYLFMAEHASQLERELAEAREQRDRLTEVIRAATVLIAAKGRHNTMLAYEGLRAALEMAKPPHET